MTDTPVFDGERLRLARMAQCLSLDDLGARVSASRQYLNQLEQCAKLPTQGMIEALAAALRVTPRFFVLSNRNSVRPEECHFRKQRTTPITVVGQVVARGTLLESFVSKLDDALHLPDVSFPMANIDSVSDIEAAAENARNHWSLGSGPIASMMRVVENAGAVVSFFDGVSERVDALSIDRQRPMIIRSEAKQTACRLRFDLAHECGHLVMHKGIVTGDKATEDQANRFASAFLLPRSSFVHEFPRGRYLDWTAIFDLKLRWKVAASALIRRAFDLKIITADQYRTGYIHLAKTGQRRHETHDGIIPMETPELLSKSLDTLELNYPGAVERMASEVGLEAEMFSRISGLEFPTSHQSSDNVVPFRN